MTALTIASLIIGIVGTAFAIIVSTITITGKIKEKAGETAKSSTLFALIQQSVSNLEKGLAGQNGKIETLEKAISDHDVSIARIDESTKSAHHRIDEIRDKLNLEVKP